MPRVETGQPNPQRSKTTVPLFVNLPPHLAAAVRQWASALQGRPSQIVASLISQEVARREERERIRQAIGE